jgi:hypothetical protein
VIPDLTSVSEVLSQLPCDSWLPSSKGRDCLGCPCGLPSLFPRSEVSSETSWGAYLGTALSPSKDPAGTRCRPCVTARPATSHGVGVRFRVLCATKYRLVGFADPAVTSSFPTRLRGFPPVAVPRRLRAGFILSSASLPLQSLSSHRPPGASRRRAPSLGFPSPSRHQPVESTTRGVSRPRFVPPSTFLTSSTAYSSTDLCGFVSPRSHVRDSLSRGFPSRAAARARRTPVPSCRWCPSPTPVARSARAVHSPSGPSSARESVATRRGLAGDPPDPLLNFPSSGSSPRAVKNGL